jgi:hypothetical protein
MNWKRMNYYFHVLCLKKKKVIDSLFLNHDVEGYLKILINGHLFENYVKFRVFSY